ncbi:MAG TPA: hypothetical protein VK966_00380 [Longimicrobiales bacterium]|nr:hypothetical protein [Longimicrobiales bacterium]
MAPPSLVAREADAWLGEDKARHMGMSFAATLFLYGAGRAALDHEAALPVAAAGSALAGVGKEVADARRGGRFSLRDLAWDAVGVGIGILLAERIE